MRVIALHFLNEQRVKCLLEQRRNRSESSKSVLSQTSTLRDLLFQSFFSCLYRFPSKRIDTYSPLCISCGASRGHTHTHGLYLSFQSFACMWTCAGQNDCRTSTYFKRRIVLEPADIVTVNRLSLTCSAACVLLL